MFVRVLNKLKMRVNIVSVFVFFLSFNMVILVDMDAENPFKMAKVNAVWNKALKVWCHCMTCCHHVKATRFRITVSDKIYFSYTQSYCYMYYYFGIGGI